MTKAQRFKNKNKNKKKLINKKLANSEFTTFSTLRKNQNVFLPASFEKVTFENSTKNVKNSEKTPFLPKNAKNSQKGRF